MLIILVCLFVSSDVKLILKKWTNMLKLQRFVSYQQWGKYQHVNDEFWNCKTKIGSLNILNSNCRHKNQDSWQCLMCRNLLFNMLILSRKVSTHLNYFLPDNLTSIEFPILISQFFSTVETSMPSIHYSIN
jgi:hypothetical protein